MFGSRGISIRDCGDTVRDMEWVYFKVWNYNYKKQKEENQIYEGEWENDKRQGFGCLTKIKEGMKFQGQFVDDELDTKEKVIIKYPNDTVYQGMIKDWRPNGFGYMAQKNGISVEGFFDNG